MKRMLIFILLQDQTFTKKGDLVTLLTNLAQDDILFIDEIHISPSLKKLFIPL